MNNKSQRQIVYERLLPYAEKNMEEITVVPGEYMGNKKCHHNARQKVEQDPRVKAVACLSFFPKNGVYLHFVNHFGLIYIDNTLGYLSQFNRYFKIKEYTLDELKAMDTHRSCMYDLLPNLQQEYLDKVFTKKELKDLKIGLEHI